MKSDFLKKQFYKDFMHFRQDSLKKFIELVFYESS